MTRLELIDRLARAIAAREGFFVTAAQAKAHGLKLPTRAQRNANPAMCGSGTTPKGATTRAELRTVLQEYEQSTFIKRARA